MNILELFAGSRSFAKVAAAHGHATFTSDNTAFEGIDYVIDILDFNPLQVPFVPDIIWASPPCTGFSVAAIGKSWNRDYTPKSDTARLGMQLVQRTLEIIALYLAVNPDLKFYVENPRGMLRKLPLMKDLPYHHTVTYCQYGDTRMKPTDIWTNDSEWHPKAACKNGAPCHVAAPRGSKNGTQGLKGAYARSQVPAGIAMEILHI
jgi:hypothetical protein